MVAVVVLLAAGLLGWWLLLPEPAPVPVADGGWTVTEVVDGDTIVATEGGVEERVRLIGIDTPERDQCGYAEASQFMADMVLGRPVTLIAGATTDRDSYDRLLRYVEHDGLDVGLEQIAAGFAIARYDSRTGQSHPREDLYRETDADTVHLCR